MHVVRPRGPVLLSAPVAISPAMRTFKTRHQFYLPDDLSEKLEDLAAKPGSSKIDGCSSRDMS